MSSFRLSQDIHGTMLELPEAADGCKGWHGIGNPWEICAPRFSFFFFGARPSFLDWLFRRGWKNSLKKNPKIFRNNCFQLIWWSLATKQLRFAYFVDVFLKPVKKNHSQPGCIFFLKRHGWIRRCPKVSKIPWRKLDNSQPANPAQQFQLDPQIWDESSWH